MFRAHSLIDVKQSYEFISRARNSVMKNERVCKAICPFNCRCTLHKQPTNFVVVVGSIVGIVVGIIIIIAMALNHLFLHAR